MRVDRTALKTNQTCIAGFLILAFVLSSTAAAIPLVAFVAAVMAIGTAIPRAALFKALYLHGLRPLGLLHPDVVADNPAQHQFAQGMGAVVLLLALLLFAVVGPVAGWALVWLVIALATINLVFGFCAGCFVYTQLHLAGIRVPTPGRNG